MKKALLTFAALFVSTIFSLAFSLDDPDNGKKLGLVSYLTYVKALSEFKMITLATNPQYKLQKDKAQSFNSAYNLLKLSTDKLINQLSVDLYQKNGLGLYKALNLYLKEGKALPDKYKAYEKLLQEIEGRQSAFMMRTYSSALAGPSIEEATGVAEQVVGAITSARDFREKKIQSVTGLIKELRLEKLAALTKASEEKPAKDE